MLLLLLLLSFTMYHNRHTQGLPMPNLGCGPPRSEDLHMALSFYQVPQILPQYFTFRDGGHDDYDDDGDNDMKDE